MLGDQPMEAVEIMEGEDQVEEIMEGAVVVLEQILEELIHGETVE